MGITNQEMPKSHFDEAVKKPGPQSARLSKKNLVFLVFAVIILQVADTIVLWLVGASASLQATGSAIHADMFTFSAVIFGILKLIYDKGFSKRPKVCVTPAVEEASSAEEVPTDDFRQSATRVVDTIKVKGPGDFNPVQRSAKTTSRSAQSKSQPPVPIEYIAKVARMSTSTKPVWVESRKRALMPEFATLSAKAKKFVPSQYSGTLDTHASVFMPHAHVKKEEQLLKSEYGAEYAGDVVYRSRHWLKEICPSTKKSRKTSKSPEPVVLVKAVKAPAAKKWVPKNDPNAVWKSQWLNC